MNKDERKTNKDTDGKRERKEDEEGLAEKDTDLRTTLDTISDCRGRWRHLVKTSSLVNTGRKRKEEGIREATRKQFREGHTLNLVSISCILWHLGL